MKKLIKKLPKPTFDEEKRLWNKGYAVLGIDEVGRGAFAGPIVAAAVIFDKVIHSLQDVNDSKLLSPIVREKLFKEIKKQALCYAIAQITVPIINKVCIGKANKMVFRKAVSAISKKIKKQKIFVLVDGFHVSYLRGIGLKNQKAIIKGDQKSISIAAASIIAKVYRDKLMQNLHKKYPVYGFDQNKGYGTRKHKEALKKYGLSKIHRLSFNLAKYL